ncbi:hypothetical protein NL676_008611 [Syzygium grande]|nr:hypothetical protein NL676_008611 [Syzygium grande]
MRPQLREGEETAWRGQPALVASAATGRSDGDGGRRPKHGRMRRRQGRGSWHQTGKREKERRAMANGKAAMDGQSPARTGPTDSGRGQLRCGSCSARDKVEGREEGESSVRW